MVPIVWVRPELLTMPIELPFVWPDRRMLLPLRVKALEREKVRPLKAVRAVKLLLRVVWPLVPKISESPAIGGALPPVQLPGELQLASVLPVQVSVAAEAWSAGTRMADKIMREGRDEFFMR